MNKKRNFSTTSLLSENHIKPAKEYNNADTQKLQILADNKGKSGVYLLINKESGKSYVGSSVNLKKRFTQYFNIKYLMLHSNMAISRALLKYGYLKFKLEIIEYCDSKDLLKREQYYIDLLKPEYNILKTAGSLLGFKHTEKTRTKMSISKTGYKHTDETRAKMSTAKIGLLAGEKNPMFGRAGELNPMFGKKHTP